MAYSWVPLVGEFQQADGTITFKGEPIDVPVGGTIKKQPQVGQSLCDQTLGEGRISAEITASEVSDLTSAEFLLYYDPVTRDMLAAGLGGNGHLFALRYWNNRAAQWLVISGTGNRSNFKAGRPYKVQVALVGSQVSMTVEGVAVGNATLPFQPAISQVGVLCASNSDIVFKDFSVATELPRAFVVMQFTPPYDELYTDVILPVCKELGIGAIRADDAYGPGVILADIIKQIVNSKVIIADITPPNLNVYYEVGYAHALNKPTILIADKDKLAKLPFDVSPFRTLFYENSIGGKAKVEEGLRKFLEAIIPDGRRLAANGSSSKNAA